jgi:hypothetical protein
MKWALIRGIDHMSAMRIVHHISAQGGIIQGFESYCGGLSSWPMTAILGIISLPGTDAMWCLQVRERLKFLQRGCFQIYSIPTTV